jgi:hypothetical protein
LSRERAGPAAALFLAALRTKSRSSAVIQMISRGCGIPWFLPTIEDWLRIEALAPNRELVPVNLEGDKRGDLYALT